MFFSTCKPTCCDQRNTVKDQAQAAAYIGLALLGGAVLSGATDHYGMMGGFFLATAASFAIAMCLAHRAGHLNSSEHDEEQAELRQPQRFASLDR